MAPMKAVANLRESQGEIGERFRKHGGLGALLVDMTPLARIERSFGGDAYSVLRSQLEDMMIELRKQVREDDVLARDDRHSERFVLFLSQPREEGAGLAVADLKGLADRIEEFVAPRVGRLTLPYLRERPSVDVGYAFHIHSPLENDERQILRLLKDPQLAARLGASAAERARNRLTWHASQKRLLDLYADLLT